MGAVTKVSVSPDNAENPSLAVEAAAMDAADPTASAMSGGDQKILGKFNSYQDLEKSYQALEHRLGAVEGPELPEGPGDMTAEEVVNAAGLDFAELSDRYAGAGRLEDDDYAALEAGGIPRQTVDDYIKGQEARLELVDVAVERVMGGEQRLEQVVEWAGSTLNNAEIEAYNAAIDSGEKTRAERAAGNLLARYRTEGTFEPDRQFGGRPFRGSSSDIYENMSEVATDMKSQSYKKSAAEQRRVKDKISRSPGL